MVPRHLRRRDSERRREGDPSPTIATGLSLQHNSLNFLRVFGALLVIAVHSPTITGLGEDPRIGFIQIGILPVAYFFVISGFLITGSRFNLSGRRFAARRLARIVPGYWMCVVVTGFVIAWIAARRNGTWSVTEAGGYVAAKLFFLPAEQLTGIISDSPNDFTWNGSVWTIPLELTCYLGIGCVLAISMLRRRLRVLSVVGLAVLTVFGTWVSFDFPEPAALYFVTFFATGIVLYAWQERIPLNDRLGVLSLLVVVGCFSSPHTVFIGAIPFGYLVLWFGARAPDVLKRIGSKNDISYGVYVYAWPVQQLLVVYGLAQHGLWVFNLVAMAIVVVCAWLSWLLVERRANEWVRQRTSTRARDARTG